jgi:putative ABC transport system permease protein
MPLLPRVSSLWRNLFHCGRLETEVDEEVRAYAGILAEEHERAGMSPKEARRAAAIQIGGVEQVKEAVRDVRLGSLLGAREGDVLRLVVRQGMATALAGAAAGLAGAAGLTRLMSSLLYGVGATDAATFLAVTLVLIAAALAASYIPARRAARIDPLVALRHD